LLQEVFADNARNLEGALLILRQGILADELDNEADGASCVALEGAGAWIEQRSRAGGFGAFDLSFSVRQCGNAAAAAAKKKK